MQLINLVFLFKLRFATPENYNNRFGLIEVKIVEVFAHIFLLTTFQNVFYNI